MATVMQLPELNAFKDIPGYKAILKAVIKSQIQFLVEQLSQQAGEESVLLTASLSDGTLSHLGSESGKVFLDRNDDFKSQFLGFCIKRHHTTMSKAGVKKKPPTAKRSVPFGFKIKPKRQQTASYPVALTAVVHKNDSDNPVPDIATDLPSSKPDVETETLQETLQQDHIETENSVDNNEDAASDKTIENYPVVKKEPVDESDEFENQDYDSSFDTSISGLDTSVTNGEEAVPAKRVKKSSLTAGENAAMIKLEYPGSDFMTDTAENSADISHSIHDESVNFDYGQGSGSMAEHQLFFSQAEATPKTLIRSVPSASRSRKHRFIRRQQYSIEDMANAINAVRRNEMKKVEASKHYGVPLTTLLDKLSGKSPEITLYGRREQEMPVKTAKKTRPKRFYTREAMSEALDAVRSGRMTKKDASVFYNVPYSTMLDKLCGRSPE